MPRMKKAYEEATSGRPGDTPPLRLFALLEVIAQRDEPFTQQAIVQKMGLPKPTVHRMLQQLEAAGLLQREGNGRHYGGGHRLRLLAEQLMLNSATQGARHAVLRQLVDTLGESCNLTCFARGEVLYLDRVETAAPLRFYLHPGSRVPAHCSATGKLFLSLLSPAQRQRLLSAVALERFTAATLTDLDALEREIAHVAAEGHALDNEEFLPGLRCIGVLVPSVTGRANLGIAVQAPTIRFSKDKTPYKTMCSAVISPQGKKSNSMHGIYFELGPEHVRAYGGVYEIEKDDLYALREGIASNPTSDHE